MTVVQAWPAAGDERGNRCAGQGCSRARSSRERGREERNVREEWERRFVVGVIVRRQTFGS